MITKEIFDVLVEHQHSEENLAKKAVITRAGSKKFNENFFRNDRRIVIVGLKVGYIYNVDAYKDTNSDEIVPDRTSLISEEDGKGIAYPVGGYILPGSMSTEEGRYPKDDGNGNIQLVGNGNVRLLVPFTFSKDTLIAFSRDKLSDSLDVGGDSLYEINQINEMGVYAQVFQSVKSWESGTAYEEGALVMHTDINVIGDDRKPVTRFYRANEKHISNPTNGPSATVSPWARYGYAESPLQTDDTWVPVYNTELEKDDPPFLLYYVAKYEHPLCIEFGHSTFYMLAIDLLDGLQLQTFYLNQEDTIAFPEIQLAYLATLVTSHRYARDVHRENQVLKGSKGTWQLGRPYTVNDIVVSKEWVGQQASQSGWGTIDKLWRCNADTYSGNYPPCKNTPYWTELKILGNSSKNDLQKIGFSSGVPDYAFNFTFSEE